MVALNRSYPVESIFGLLPLLICPVSAFFSDAGFVGSALIFSAAVSCMLLLLLKKGDASWTIKVGWPFFALSACYLASLMLFPSVQGVKHFLAVLTILFFFCFYMVNGWAIVKNPIFVFGAMASSIIFIGPSVFSVNEKNFDGGMAFYGLCLAVFIFLGSRPPGSAYARIVVFAFGVLASFYGYIINFRMLVVYGVFLVLIYLFFSFAPGAMRHYGKILFSLFVAMIVMVIFYVEIENFSYLSEVNDFLVEKTERTALSGRQIIWPVVISAVFSSPIFGLGAGVLPSDLIDTQLSSHNYYLQVALQVGVLGLFFALFAVFVIWKIIFSAHKKSASSLFAASVLIVFIVHNASEVIMFQNALRVSIPAWIILFISASTIRHESRFYEK